MKIFAIDSPLMRVLGKISDLMILNILTLLCCIPLVTAGAAFTAMHYVSLKMVRGEESGITKMFFHSFKDNLKQSTVIWILFLLVAAIFGLNFMLLYANPTEVSTFVFGPHTFHHFDGMARTGPLCKYHSPYAEDGFCFFLPLFSAYAPDPDQLLRSLCPLSGGKSGAHAHTSDLHLRFFGTGLSGSHALQRSFP